MLKHTVKIQTILAHLLNSLALTREFGILDRVFRHQEKKNVENTQEFVRSENFDNILESDNQYQTGNTTYENNWENEESWEQDTQDSNTNKQEIIQQNELQIGEIIEIYCKPKEKTVEADETENTYVFTENKQISEAETVDIVENVDNEIQTKENEHMENKNTEAKKKKDKSKVGKKKFEDKTGDKDKTKSTKNTQKKGMSVNIRRSFETKIDGIIKDYGDCEIICLHECGYIKRNVISDLENNKDFKIYFSQGELHTKGVVTLVKNDIECTNHYFKNHILNGRLVHTSFKADDKVLNLFNIYSPTKSTGQQGMFYREYCASVNVESYRNIMLGDFNCIDQQIDTNNPNNEENKTQPDQVTINNFSEIIIDLENKEKKGTIIRSRQDYYEEDIDNIDFFKREEDQRGDKREVESILDKNGKSCTSRSEVMKVVTDFYSDLYKSQNIDRHSMIAYLEDLELNKLTEEDKTNFDTFITQDECLKLLKEFKNNKSPGVDGIGKSFYTKFWNIIGEDLVEVLNNVYLNRELTESMKTGLISLNYKNKETLACKIRTNNNIQGIQIPNHNSNVKLFQHADDCSIISTNLTDYEKLFEEFKNFGMVSGSKINENKTEILKIGNPNTTNFDNINKLIKVLGIWYGKKNALKIKWKKKYNGLINHINKWKKRKLRYKHKVLILNTYVHSKFLYTARIYPPSEYYIRKINKVIYDLFWDNIELLNRTTIIKQYKDGGQQVPDIKMKSEALLLYRVSQVLTGNKSVWTSLFIYFIGITTRAIPKLADNMYRHSVVTIGQYDRLKFIYLKYKSNMILNNKSFKDVYLQLLELNNVKNKIEIQYPNVKFQHIWNNLQRVNNLYIRDFICKVVHTILPTGAWLSRRNFYRKTYKCCYCNKHMELETLEHLFTKCVILTYFRNLVCSIIQNEKNCHNFSMNTNTCILFDLDTDLIPYIYGYVHSIWTCRYMPKEHLLQLLMLKYYKH
ncbi:unnamed protein product [Mytilus coruscus]|uniref:Reverse transcriptase zinc-binding domain-containing protein n=1 Tax=Mytilus coruscus TaxID=42192 RepID=A0A6J8APU6_MYTCO|nr:unnamed protein product [Mytilus coruscus]